MILLLFVLIFGAVGYFIYNSFFLPDPAASGWRDREDAIFYRGEALKVYTDVERSPYDPELFYYDGQYLKYDDPSYDTAIGIDISTYQGSIDWQAVKDSGVEFAIIRLGYRGYTIGSISEDLDFKTNIEGALAAGIEVGVYFYSQAMSQQEAVEEAEFVLELISGYDVSYPVVFDWEPVYSEDSRTNNFNGKDLTDCCIAFCDRIAQVGYTPMIYFYRDLAYYNLELPRIIQYDWWLAEYNEVPNFYYNYHMIQFSNQGTVPGIDGNVDLNLSFFNYSDS